MEAGRGWHSRGYLPHLESEARTQFVTWRLADSLPAVAIERIQLETAQLPEGERKREHRRLVEAFLDSGAGSCLLRQAGIGGLVQDSIFACDGVNSTVHAWVVMPNHVHLLVTPDAKVPLATVIKRIKGSASRAINQRLGRHGRLWQPDYFDKIIQKSDQFDGVVQYIEWNPVKAKLSALPSAWSLSSANEVSRRRLDVLRQERLRRSPDFDPE